METTITAMMGTLVRRSTLPRNLEKGSPLSRAKDQVMRDAVVVMPTEQHQVRIRTTAPMVKAPLRFPTLSICGERR